MSDNISIKIKKRPLLEWLLWLVWAVLLVFIFQNAMASGTELESRAATIFWVSFVVWFLAGAVVWFTRRSR